MTHKSHPITTHLKKIHPLLIRHKDLLNGFSFFLGLRLVEKIAALTFGVLLFRMMGKLDISYYGLIQTTVSISSIFALQEFQNTIAQSTARGFTGTIRQATIPIFLTSLCGSMLLLLCAWWFQVSEHTPLSSGFAVAALLFPFYQGLNLWRGFYIGQKQYKDYSFAEAGNAIFKTVAAIVLFVYVPSPFLPLVALAFLFPSIQNIVRTISLLSTLPTNAPCEKGSLNYGFKSSINGAMSILANNIDKILLFNLLSPIALATYMVAEKTTDLIQGLVQDMAATLIPKFAQTKSYTKRLDNILKMISIALGAGIISFSLFIVPFLVPILFGEKYADAVPYAQVLACSSGFRNITSLRMRFIRSKLDGDGYRKIALYPSYLHIPLAIVLIYTFGLWGAVVSVFIYRALQSLIADRIIKEKYLNVAH